MHDGAHTGGMGGQLTTGRARTMMWWSFLLQRAAFVVALVLLAALVWAMYGWV